jgi:ComF family protein
MFYSVQPKSLYLQHNKHNERMFEQIISLVAPFECLRCTAEGTLLCTACLNNTLKPTKIELDQSVLSEAYAACVYKGVAKELVAILKFGRAKAASLPMAQALKQLLPAETDVVIVHVPTATSRVRMRGYDQAALIAKELARISQSLYAPLLHRQGQQRQVGKRRSRRAQQLTEAFWVDQNAVSPNITYILVDDVITTGSTFMAAGKTLRQAGASRIIGIAFAAA